MSSLERVKMFLEEVDTENIYFKQHFYERVKERSISEEIVLKYIQQTDRLLQVESQPARKEEEEKFKIWIKLSSKYSLVLIISIFKAVGQN